MAGVSDALQNLLNAVKGDPNDPAVQKQKMDIIHSFAFGSGGPQVQPSSAPDTLDETPCAGSDGGNDGFRQSKPVPGSSEMSGGSPDLAEPKASPGPVGMVKAGHVPRSMQPDNDNDADLKNVARSMVASGMTVPGASAEPGFAGADLENHVGLPVPPRTEAEPGSTEDLENHVESSVPGMFAAAANPQKPHGVLGVLGAIGKGLVKYGLPRISNAAYAVSGGDPRAMRLKEQGEQFQEEMEREKSDPEYQRRVAAATTPPEIQIAPDGKGGYQYVRIDKFSGQATPTGQAAPMPEKTPAQLLGEFVQNHPDALTKGTPANIQYEELAEGMRAFPSNQAQIRANAEMYVGRMGVQRAVVQANGLIRAMQGRNISEAQSEKAAAINDAIKAAATGWAEFYTQHPYLQAMGYGPDADSQARFLADYMNQLSDVALETNQLTQKIPGAAHVVPTNQVPIISPAANAANRNQRHPQLTADQIKRGGRLQHNGKTGAYRVVYPNGATESVR